MMLKQMGKTLAVAVAGVVLTLISSACIRSSKLVTDVLTDRPFEQQDIFVSGQDGYHTYRIPALIVTQRGTVLAFCEGRMGGRSDSGNIDLLLKRSTDEGTTWSRQQTVWDDGPNTCGNPCPVVDRETGTVWLLMTHNLGIDPESKIVDGTSKGTRTVWVTHSTDDGLSWTDPIEITSSVKKPDWSWYATGPGVGIQLQRAPHTGRMLIPCDHKTLGDTVGYYSHVIYSDDGGRTWELGGSTDDGVNECQVIEKSDGTLLLNMRCSRNNQTGKRGIATSGDGGMTWSALRYDETLIEPRCQGSLLRYTWGKKLGENRILFSNPDSAKREKMTVRLSYDEGTTWPVSRLIHGGSSAYSCLSAIPGGPILCLYERDNYGKITLARFTLAWLTRGGDGA